MEKKRYIIIKKDLTPVRFKNDVVVVYPTITEAKRDFDMRYDLTIASYKEYKESKRYVQFDKFSIGI